MKTILLLLLVGVVSTFTFTYSNFALDLEDFHITLVKSAGSVGGVPWGPMKNARTDVILFTAAYDTWALNDATALPTVATRIKKKKFTGDKLLVAIAHATYTVLSHSFGSLNTAMQDIIDKKYAAWGFTISDSTDRSTPAGLGNAVGNAINRQRDKDGSNFDGSNKNSNGQKYSDWTNYRPSVDPFPKLFYTDCSKLDDDDLSHWQPAIVESANGLVEQTWGDVHFTNVKTWGISSPAEVRVRGPPLPNNSRRPFFLKQIDLMLAEFAQLDDERKVIAQNWISGTEGISPTGHLARIAWHSARLLGLSLEQTIKLLFVHAHSQFDTMISQFEGKRFYDPPRPTTPIQCIDSDEKIMSWLGPYLGVGEMKRSEWRAYLPGTVVQNGTPEYPCGHCSISGASAEILRLFYNGNDTFVGVDEVWEEGSLPMEKKITDKSDPGYIKGVTDVPNSGPFTKGYAPASRVVLSYSTWTDVEITSSHARMLLGVHWQDSATQARKMGHKISQKIWEKAQTYFNGEAYCAVV